MATALAFEQQALTSEQERTEAVQEVFRLISGFWLSRAVQVAATMAIPDLLANGPRSVDEVATATGTSAPALYRLMRALASFGFFRELDGRRFAQTAKSDILRTGAPGSLRSAVISELGRVHYASWANLEKSVRTGEIAFDRLYGMNAWEYFQQHPDLGATFDESMTRLTEAVLAAIRNVYDFAPYKRVVDVAGGQGRLLSGILETNPEATGVLMDRAQVIEEARVVLARDPIAVRIDLVAGDFFDSVPAGGDLYTLKWIIHDWAEAEALCILRNVRQAMAPHARVLLVETVLPEPNTPHFGPLMDLNMLVMTGGRERTGAEYRELLARAGLEVIAIHTTESPVSIVEAIAAG